MYLLTYYSYMGRCILLLNPSHSKFISFCYKNLGVCIVCGLAEDLVLVVNYLRVR